MVNLDGFYSALPTPFTGGEKIALQPLGDLVALNLASGLDGLYVGGSTAEAFLMTVDERETVLQAAAQAAGGRGTLIAHVGDPNPQVSAQLAKVAENAGYDAISAVPPFYYRYGIDEIAEHYAWLANQVDLPFVIYNFPKLSGVRWSVAELARLLSLPNICGVKNTCSDLYAFEQLRRIAPDKVLLHGFDETLLAGLALGANGGIGSTYNVQPQRILAIAQAHKAGHAAAAQAHQAEANGLIDAMVKVGVLPSLKYLLSLQGIDMGVCRRPFKKPTSEDCRVLDKAAENYLAQAPTDQSKSAPMS